VRRSCFFSGDSKKIYFKQKQYIPENGIIIIQELLSFTNSAMLLKGKRRNNDPPKRRVVVLGAAGVGKSSILSRLLYNKFLPEHIPTVEDFHQADLRLRGRTLQLDIVDMTGHYSFPAMTELAIACADAFVLVFNVSDEESFRHVSSMRDLIFEVKDNATDIPIVVVGNMIDIDQRRSVDKTATECLVTMDWNHPYVETSAKTNHNIRKVFDELLVRSNIPGVSTSSSRRKYMNRSQKRLLEDTKDKCSIS